MKTYSKMNKEIVEILRISKRPHELYAALRIEELEEQNRELAAELALCATRCYDTCKDLVKENRKIDQDLFNKRGEYIDCTIIRNRAIFTLRMIAGVAYDLPENQNGPEYAYAWLKEHDLLANQPKLPIE